MLHVLFGRMGLAVGMLLLGLGMGTLLWASHADASIPAIDAAYTAVTPCVVFDSRATWDQWDLPRPPQR